MVYTSRNFEDQDLDSSGEAAGACAFSSGKSFRSLWSDLHPSHGNNKQDDSANTDKKSDSTRSGAIQRIIPDLIALYPEFFGNGKSSERSTAPEQAVTNDADSADKIAEPGVIHRLKSAAYLAADSLIRSSLAIVSLSDGLVTTAENDTEQELLDSTPLETEKKHSLSLTPEGDINELQTPEGTIYRNVGDGYLVSSPEHSEGRMGEPDEFTSDKRNSNATVQREGVSQVYASDTEVERASSGSSTNSLYDYSRQVTIAATKVIAGTEAAKKVGRLFEEPSKLFAPLAEITQKAQEQAITESEHDNYATPETTAERPGPASGFNPGTAKPLSGSGIPAERKPAESNPNDSQNLDSNLINSSSSDNNSASSQAGADRSESSQLRRDRAQSSQPVTDIANDPKPAIYMEQGSESGSGMEQSHQSVAVTVHIPSSEIGSSYGPKLESGGDGQAPIFSTEAGPGNGNLATNSARVTDTTNSAILNTRIQPEISDAATTARTIGQISSLSSTPAISSTNTGSLATVLSLRDSAGSNGGQAFARLSPANANFGDTGTALSLRANASTFGQLAQARDLDTGLGISPAVVVKPTAAGINSEWARITGLDARPIHSDIATLTKIEQANPIIVGFPQHSTQATVDKTITAHNLVKSPEERSEALSKLITIPSTVKDQSTVIMGGSFPTPFSILQTKVEPINILKQDQVQSSKLAEQNIQILTQKLDQISKTAGLSDSISRLLTSMTPANILPLTLNQALIPPLNSVLNPTLSTVTHTALNPTLNTAINTASNPNLRMPTDTAGRVDTQIAGQRVASDTVSPRNDRVVRGAADTSEHSDSSLVSAAPGKTSKSEGRYMIAELTLAMVLAAGGIRRVLPTDTAGRGDAGGNTTGPGRRQIERELSGKSREQLGVNGFKFMPASFKIAQLGQLKNSDSIRMAFNQANLTSGKRLWLGPNSSAALVKPLGIQGREIPGLVRQSHPLPSSLGFTQNQLIPALVEGVSGRQFRLPPEATAFSQLLRSPQQTIDDALAPFINAARDFIEIDDPFQSFKDVARAQRNRRGGSAVAFTIDGSSSNLERESVAGEDCDANDTNDDDDDAQQQNPVLLRPTWLISEGETLLSIAEEHFNDPYIGWLIADLNKGLCQEHLMDGKRIVEFHSRQQLTLPVWQDIVEFYGSMPTEARPENLVTIVSSTQIDREVVDNVLGPIVGRMVASK